MLWRRYITPCLAVLAISSCSPAPELQPQGQNSNPGPPPEKPDPIPPSTLLASTPPSTPPPAPEKPQKTQVSSRPTAAPKITRKNINGISFEGVSFDSRTHQLAVIDQPNGPGSTYATSQSVAKSQNSLLAINAGFFTPEGAPLGLVVSGGKTSGGWNSASSLGNGIFRESKSGNVSITRRSTRSSVSASRELIQAGPLLIDNGKSISGLNATKPAVRSIIISDGGSRWWIGKTSSCTLAALGKALASASPASWKIDDALNLDGGRSTDLYISSRISGGPINRRGFLNRPVRNFLILEPR